MTPWHLREEDKVSFQLVHFIDLAGLIQMLDLFSGIVPTMDPGYQNFLWFLPVPKRALSSLYSEALKIPWDRMVLY
jgi:hypothetical protein